MSRIGKKPITVPSGVDVQIDGQSVTVKGPRGKIQKSFHPAVSIQREDGQILVAIREDDRQGHSLHGLTRTLISNMVDGVSKGFQKILEISGVGYRAQVQGRNLVMTLGFSHPVNVLLPEGISAEIEKQTILTLSGVDKELLGQVAANIRSYRKPDPYKGKGIRYKNEVVRRKAGKAGKAGK